jgi:electron transfer flavoprotein alpha subunit
MATIWVIGESVDGQPTRLALELATLARSLATATGRDAAALVLGSGVEQAASDVSRFLPRVLAAELPGDRPWAEAALRVVTLHAEATVDLVLIGASPDGKDLAGALLATTSFPILVNASGVGADGGIVAEMSTFGGRLVTRSGFAVEGGGIVLVRPGAVAAEAALSAGSVQVVPAQVPEAPAVRVVDRVAQEAGAAQSIEEARLIVGGGRGVGGPQGFEMLQELADALGGAVAATRAAVDAGWISYGQQIGQTGKIVKPDLYVACGISGAIQHKVGVQTAGTIVAINRDPDAPIAEFADLLVIGDLFEVVPMLTEAIRARKTGA